MPEPPDYSRVYYDPSYLEQAFDVCRDVRFVHKVFSLQASLEAIEPDPSGWIEVIAYDGKDYDREKYRLIEAGWDHDHCYVCWQRIEPGDVDWANETPGVCPDLCESCYDELQRRIEAGRVLSGPSSDH
jgi:hypothetical protein